MPDSKTYDLVPAQTQANQIIIQTVQDQKQAESFLKHATRLRKEINAHYGNLIDPIQKVIKEKRQEWKGHIDRLDQAIATVKQKLNIYISSENEKKALIAAAQTQKSEKDAKKDRDQQIKKLVKQGKVDDAIALKDEPLPAVVYHAEQTATGDGVSTAKILKWKVTDELAIPKKYWSQPELLTSDIRHDLHHNGLNSISGIVGWYESSIRVNA